MSMGIRSVLRRARDDRTARGAAARRKKRQLMSADRPAEKAKAKRERTVAGAPAKRLLDGGCGERAERHL